MLYKSLKNFNYKVPFKEAVLTGQSPEKGLYFPENIPVLNKTIIKNISNYDEHHLMMEVIQPFIGNEIPNKELLNIISNTVNFKINLNNIYDNIYSLELFLGPTMAFKDIGVKFMSGCIKYFCKELNKNIIILTATSGDTGAAVANAFNKIDGVKVVILYPSSKISILQEKQITTLGNNIIALEIKGNFDDCQMLVKKAFSDNQIRENLFITSANSINIARLLSQIFYYFMCYKLLLPIHYNDKLIISIPSGNFGNICAGLIAFKMGLPVKQFIAATNINDTIPRLLRTGIYNTYPTQETISNAMDISDPSNFSRIMYMFKNVNNIKKLVSAYSFSDKETFEIIKSIWENYKYIMDPHGAIGYLGLKQFIKNKKNNKKNIFLSTAAPVKFLDKISKGIDQKISLEKKVIKLLKKEKKSIQLSNKYDTFKKWLLNL
ncbi:MAG: threonine synthase [Candidatus Sulcia muelleri]|uniref:Threonine synthase n=2 Tax=cellular organisms TaxID=131567 RepID=A8Z5Z9_KARMG|nr:threonine synthase [Candidatus Karelsulcia muelleri GWSS]MBS0018888.1 threonine synthase [Candidatus Karelsulcia muelleri]MCJ7422420.1 threonine synthase [Candidatus Karelsulcia muelleri]MCJ7468857.1 threonine synthase [Candidatus Karelsulcia muelleri]